MSCVLSFEYFILFLSIQAIHVGEPFTREDPITKRIDYYGPALEITANIFQFTQGGQILISEAANIV